MQDSESQTVPGHVLFAAYEGFRKGIQQQQTPPDCKLPSLEPCCGFIKQPPADESQSRPVSAKKLALEAAKVLSEGLDEAMEVRDGMQQSLVGFG